jgi:hypothetical protein
MVLTSVILPPPSDIAASAFFIIVGVIVLASAAPPAIRLEFLRKVRRLIESGTERQACFTAGAATVQDVLVNLFMSDPLD